MASMVAVSYLHRTRSTAIPWSQPRSSAAYLIRHPADGAQETSATDREEMPGLNWPM